MELEELRQFCKYDKFVNMDCMHMQLNHLSTDSIIDAAPEPEIVVALMQMMAQLLFVELEAVPTSVDDTAAFAGAVREGRAIEAADFNAGVFSEWDFLLGVLSSSSTSLPDHFFHRVQAHSHQWKHLNHRCNP